jgi:hypothetical protein
MIRSLSARRWVIAFSIVMLLLCQTAAAALSYSAAPVTAATSQAATLEMDTAAPCHQHAQNADGHAPAHGCQDRCPSRDASFETTKIDIPAADTLVSTRCAVNPPDAYITITAPHQHIAAVAAPPPLILVYCRLLI